MISACTFRGIFAVQNAMVYAVDKYCGIQRDLRGPKRAKLIFVTKAIDRILGTNIELNELSWINMLCLLRLKGLLQRRTILLYALH
ncbi:hypothetical protein M405DRAFT_819591 [Rhizopogon salebrosus TDB-379]|nr:hypothetical protein M405DRAFT_819591 [Rhizopogon salebrosus TDB-379]